MHNEHKMHPLVPLSIESVLNCCSYSTFAGFPVSVISVQASADVQALGICTQRILVTIASARFHAFINI